MNSVIASSVTATVRTPHRHLVRGISKLRSRANRGISLFGILMGLGLAAAALVGIVALYNTATETSNRNEAQALLTQLVVATQQIHQGTSTYGTAAANLVPTIDRRGMIPSAHRVPGATPPTTTTINHPFGSTVAVAVATTTTRFNVTFNDLQAENCAQLLDPYVGQGRGTGGLWGIKVGSAAQRSPLTTANVTTDCTGTDNDVVFEFE